MLRRISLELSFGNKVALPGAGVVVPTLAVLGILAPAIQTQSQSAAPGQVTFDVVSIKPNHSVVTWSPGSTIK